MVSFMVMFVFELPSFNQSQIQIQTNPQKVLGPQVSLEVSFEYSVN